VTAPEPGRDAVEVVRDALVRASGHVPQYTEFYTTAMVALSSLATERESLRALCGELIDAHEAEGAPSNLVSEWRVRLASPKAPPMTAPEKEMGE